MLLGLALAAGLLYAIGAIGGPTAEAEATLDIVQVTPEQGNHHDPALIETLPGGLVTVYESHGEGRPGGLYYKMAASSTATWTPAMLLVEDAGQPDLGLHPDGDLWLAYTRGLKDETGEWSNIYYRTSADDGLTWSTEGTVASSTVVKHRPTVAVTDTGTVVVAWQEDTNEGGGSQLQVLRRQRRDLAGPVPAGRPGGVQGPP